MIPSNSFLQKIPTSYIVNQMAAIVQKRTSQGGGHLGWAEKAMQGDFIVLLLDHLYKTRPST